MFGYLGLFPFDHVGCTTDLPEGFPTKSPSCLGVRPDVLLVLLPSYSVQMDLTKPTSGRTPSHHTPYQHIYKNFGGAGSQTQGNLFIMLEGREGTRLLL